ncbi:hypothetical protein ACIRU3_42815 [Streptomyces sp. NPDC101151]|uniref:hypothetical protein n=1 Tax=Streptomyces sp. NPDC101151 TaxID=3366115 RepID=UPI003816468E
MTTTTDVPPEVLGALAEHLPGPDGLPDERARGRGCIWCGQHLTSETAVDLGEQVEQSDVLRWFPRGCHPCTADRAHRSMLDHASFCPLCAHADSAAACVLGRGLYRLQRECRR